MFRNPAFCYTVSMDTHSDSSSNSSPFASTFRGIRRFFSRRGAVLKTIGIVLAVIILLPILLVVLQFSARTVNEMTYSLQKQAMPSRGGSMMDVDGGWGAAMDESASYGMAPSIAPTPMPGEWQGSTVTLPGTEEDYEIRSYDVQYRSGDIERTCGEIEALRSRTVVIFERQSTHRTSCSYTFKVERASAEEILAVLEAMDPYQLSAQTQSIKRTLEHQMSEIVIQQDKLAAIEKALSEAQQSYDEIQRVATSARDTESLTRIIENKLNLIDRLTREQLNVKQRLDQLAAAQAEQRERLEYVFFQVSVMEYKVADLQQMKDQWFAAAREFVDTLNRTLQGLSLTLLIVLVKIIQYGIYILLGVFVAKYGWRLIVKIWKM